MLNSHLCWNLPAATDVRTRFQTRHRRRISSRPWRRVFFFFSVILLRFPHFFWGGLCFFQDWTCFIWWNTMNWMVMWLRLFFRRVWFRAEMFSENGTCTMGSSAPNIGYNQQGWRFWLLHVFILDGEILVLVDAHQKVTWRKRKGRYGTLSRPFIAKFQVWEPT